MVVFKLWVEMLLEAILLLMLAAFVMSVLHYASSWAGPKPSPEVDRIDRLEAKIDRIHNVIVGPQH
jgi:hypothetical protein